MNSLCRSFREFRVLRFAGPIIFAAISIVSGSRINAQSTATAANPAKSGTQTQGATPKSAQAPEGNAESGKKLYMKYGCYQCHGTEAHGVTPGPQLGPDPSPFNVFLAYVRHPDGEMPPYTDKVVSDQEFADIYAFVKSVARAPDAKTIPLLNHN